MRVTSGHVLAERHTGLLSVGPCCFVGVGWGVPQRVNMNRALFKAQGQVADVMSLDGENGHERTYFSSVAFLF